MAGYKAERRAKQYLEREGYTVLKMAGSKGAFDLVAYSIANVRFIQIKRTGKKQIPPYREEIKKLLIERVPEYATKELWVWQKNIGWHFLPIR
jgi:Holliday junction resolvase